MDAIRAHVVHSMDPCSRGPFFLSRTHMRVLLPPPPLVLQENSCGSGCSVA